MLSSIVTAWAKMYFFTSIGKTVSEEGFGISEDVIQNTYKEEFLIPVTKVLYGKEKDDLKFEEASKFLQVAPKVKIPSLFHVLRYLSVEGYLKHSKDVMKSLKECEKKFIPDIKVCYGVVQGGQPFRCPVDHNGNVLGTYTDNVLVLGSEEDFPNGLQLESLAEKDPLKLKDPEVKALRVAVKQGVLPLNYLKTNMFCIPKGSSFSVDSVTAATENLPSYAVRKLMLSVPDSLVSEAGDIYNASLNYAEDHPEAYGSLIPELKSYLPERPTVDTTGDIRIALKEFLQANDISEEISLREFITEQKDQKADLQNAYDVLKKSKLYDSVFLTNIRRAIRNGKQVTYPTISRILSRAKMTDEERKAIEYSVSRRKPLELPEKEQSFEELSGKDMINSLCEAKVISEAVEEELTKAYYAEQTFELPMLEDYLKSCNMSEEMKQEVIKSLSTVFTIPKNEVMEYLRRENIDENLIECFERNDFTPYKSTHITTPDLLDSLYERGIISAEFLNVLQGYADRGTTFDVPTEDGVQESKPGLNDGSYVACEYLLRKVREHIVENDTMEFRSDILPIVYSFVRLLMLRAGTTGEAISYLESKTSDCGEEGAAYIKEAIRIMREME